jgi:hypothetical protein
MAIAHAPNRWRFEIDVPDAFPEYNTGVILFKNTELVRNLLVDWYELFTSQLDANSISSQDQPSFRYLLYKSDIRFATLTPEYNCRFTIGAMVSHRVKILHGRTDDYKKIAKEINEYELSSGGYLKARSVKYEEKVMF